MTKDPIIQEIDQLSKRYQNLFELTEDIKALQGMERCLEMKIKAVNQEPKNLNDQQISSDNIQSVILSELPTSMLQEIMRVINNKPQTP